MSEDIREPCRCQDCEAAAIASDMDAKIPPAAKAALGRVYASAERNVEMALVIEEGDGFGTTQKHAAAPAQQPANDHPNDQEFIERTTVIIGSGVSEDLLSIEIAAEVMAEAKRAYSSAPILPPGARAPGYRTGATYADGYRKGQESMAAGGPVAWRWRSIFNEALWTYGEQEPPQHEQYVTEALYSNHDIDALTGNAELLRHQRIEAAKDAIMRCQAFADMMAPPSMCALDMATAAVDAAFAPRTPAAAPTQGVGNWPHSTKFPEMNGRTIAAQVFKLADNIEAQARNVDAVSFPDIIEGNWKLIVEALRRLASQSPAERDQAYSPAEFRKLQDIIDTQADMLIDLRNEVNQAAVQVESVRAKIEALPRYGYSPTGICPIRPNPVGDYVFRDEAIRLFSSTEQQQGD